MTAFIPESGPATDPNAVSPPDPAYATCDNCGASLEDARFAAVDRGPGILALHTMEGVYLCPCGQWYFPNEVTR